MSKVQPWNFKTKYLFWKCDPSRKGSDGFRGCGVVFRTVKGKIPHKCPNCGMGCFIHGITDDDYEITKNNQARAFSFYRYSTGDTGKGCYGRFMARMHKLPEVRRDKPLDIQGVLMERIAEVVSV